MAIRKPTKAELRQKAYDDFFTNKDDSSFLDTIKKVEEDQARPDFSNIVSTTDTVDPAYRSPLERVTKGIGDVGNIVADSAIGGFKRSVGAGLFADADIGQGTNEGFGQAVTDTAKAVIPGSGIMSVIKDLIDPEFMKTLGGAAFNEGSAQAQRGQDLAESAAPVGQFWSRAIADVASSPSSLGSIPGGAFGAVPMADVFNQEYTGARLKGVPRDMAAVRAGMQASGEAISFVPAGKILSKVPGLKKIVGKEAEELLKSDATRFLARTGKTMAGEGLEEGVTTLVQLGLDKLLSVTASDDTTRRYAESNLPNSVVGVWDQVVRSAAAGTAGGVTLGAPMEGIKIAQERGQAVAQILAHSEDTKTTEKFRDNANALDLGKPTADLFADHPAPEAVATDIAADTSIPLGPTREQAAQLAHLNSSIQVLEEKPTRTAQESDRLLSLKAARNRLVGQEGDIPRARLVNTTEPVVNPDAVAADREIKNLEIRASLGKATSDQLTRLEQLKTQRASMPDTIDKPATKIENLGAPAPSLGLNFPTQPLNPEFTGLPSTAPAPKAAPIPKTAATTAYPKSQPTKKSKRAPASEAQQAAQDDVRATYKTNFPKASEQEIDAMIVEDGHKPNATPAQQLAALKTSVGISNAPKLAMKSDNVSTTDVTPDNVFSHMVKNVGKGSTRLLTKLMNDGNVKVVSDVSYVPDGAAPKGAGGFYDGKTTYIVANQLDPKNITGSMLEVAAHEVKHGADLSGKVTLGGFVGEENNKKINAKIEKLADMGNPVAVAAREAAKAGSTDETYHLELPAYFINEARGKRSSAGLVGSVVGDIVSAVRVAGKNVIGNTDVNLNDVAYLSDKLLEKVAVEGKPLTSKDAKGNAMIVGKKARHYAVADELGLTFQSRDGGSKYVISDKSSAIKLPKLNDNGTAVVKLPDVLDHDDLYNEYPELRNVQVVFRRFPDNSHAAAMYTPAHNGQKGHIQINVDRTLSGSYNSAYHKHLLHETQHAIQDIEGHDNGDNISNYLPKEYTADKVEEDKLASELAEFGRNIFRGSVKRYGVDTSRPEIKKLIDEASRVAKTKMTQDEYSSSDHERAALAAIEALGVLAYEDSTHTESIKQVYDTAAAYETVHNANIKTWNKAYHEYRSNLGEEEAFFTQNNIGTELDDLPPNPEKLIYPKATLNKDSQAKDLSNTSQGLAYTPRLTTQRLKVKSGPALDFFKKMAFSFGGVGRQLGNMIENAGHFSEVFSHRAGKYEQLIARGNKKAAKRLGVSEEALTKTVSARLKAIAEIPLARREAALAGLVREYPELRAIGRAVADINNLSRVLLRQYLEAYPDPTPEQLDLMNKLHNNAFKYITNIYSAFQGEAGVKYAKNMQEAYNSVTKLTEQKDKLPPRLVAKAQVWKNAMDYITEHNLTIPDEESIGNIKDSHLNNLFSTWVAPADQFAKAEHARAIADGMTEAEADAHVRTAMEAKLLDVAPTLEKADYEGKANLVVESMLGLGQPGNPVADYYRGQKQDRTILQERTHMPEPIQKLFGKIEDPAAALAITLAKQAELAGRTRLLLDMRDTKGQEWVVPEAQAGRPGNEKYSVRLSGENFGPLEGWHTTPLVAKAIGDQLQMYSNMADSMGNSYFDPNGFTAAILRATGTGVVKAAQWSKLATVVMDVFNGLQNAIGSPIALMNQGFGAYKHVPKGLKVGAQAVADVIWTSEGQLTDAFEDAVRYGLLDSARAQEIRNTPFDYVKKLIADEKRGFNFIDALKTGKNITVEAYAMADAWIKIPAFNYRVEVLTNYYKAKGENPGQAAIKKEAADVVKDTTIGFARTPGIVRGLERVGATTFLPYFLATFKTQYASLAVAAKDFIRANNEPNKKAANVLYKHALDRTAGTLTMLSLLTLGVKGIAAALNGGDDKDKLEEQKKLLFKDARYSDEISLGKDEKGNPVFFRLSRLDPFGPMTDLFRIAMNDELSPEEKNKAVIESFEGLFFANRGVVTLGKAVLGAVHGIDIDSKKGKLERIAPATVARQQDAVEKVPGLDYNDGKAVSEVIDGYVPGVMDAFDPKNNGPAKPKGKWQGNLGTLVTAIGGRLDTADPQQAMYGATKDLAAIRAEGRAKINQAKNANLTKTEVVNRFLDSAEAEYEAMRDVSEKYDAMVKGLGYTQHQAMEVLKDNNAKGGLTAADMALISQGRVPSESEQWIKEYSRILSASSLEKRTDRGLNETQKKQSKTEQDKFLAEMKALGFKVQEH